MADKEGRGKKSQNSVVVVYGSPLKRPIVLGLRRPRLFIYGPSFRPASDSEGDHWHDAMDAFRFSKYVIVSMICSFKKSRAASRVR